MSAPTFELAHPAGLIVSPALSLASLLAALPDVGATKRDMRTGWTWYSLPRFNDGAVVVAISLGFEGSRLAQIGVLDGNEVFGRGWDGWSEENERLRAESIGSWLAAQGFPSGKYSWGEGWSGLDPKGGFGSAGVR